MKVILVLCGFAMAGVMVSSANVPSAQCDSALAGQNVDGFTSCTPEAREICKYNSAWINRFCSHHSVCDICTCERDEDQRVSTIHCENHIPDNMTFHTENFASNLRITADNIQSIQESTICNMVVAEEFYAPQQGITVELSENIQQAMAPVRSCNALGRAACSTHKQWNDLKCRHQTVCNVCQCSRNGEGKVEHIHCQHYIPENMTFSAEEYAANLEITASDIQDVHSSTLCNMVVAERTIVRRRRVQLQLGANIRAIMAPLQRCSTGRPTCVNHYRWMNMKCRYATACEICQCTRGANSSEVQSMHCEGHIPLGMSFGQDSYAPQLRITSGKILSFFSSSRCGMVSAIEFGLRTSTQGRVDVDVDASLAKLLLPVAECSDEGKSICRYGAWEGQVCKQDRLCNRCTCTRDTATAKVLTAACGDRSGLDLESERLAATFSFLDSTARNTINPSIAKGCPGVSETISAAIRDGVCNGFSVIGNVTRVTSESVTLSNVRHVCPSSIGSDYLEQIGFPLTQLQSGSISGCNEFLSANTTLTVRVSDNIRNLNEPYFVSGAFHTATRELVILQSFGTLQKYTEGVKCALKYASCN